jgi:hypothetical protein
MMVSMYDEEAIAVSVVEKDMDPGTSSLAAASHQVADERPGRDDVRWRPSPRQLRQRRPGRRAVA